MKNECENCGKCCLETEMILSQEDVDLIINNSLNKSYRDYFTFEKSNEYYQLKNIEGHCVFFDLTRFQSTRGYKMTSRARACGARPGAASYATGWRWWG